MSDYLSQATFDLIWDDFRSVTENQGSNQEDTASNIVEISREAFFEEYGVDIYVFDDDFNIESRVCDGETVAFEENPIEDASNENDCNESSVARKSSNEFVSHSDNDVLQILKESENKKTVKKINLDVNKIVRFLHIKNERREIQDIPPEELDAYLANFILSVSKNDEYEPTTIRNIISSTDRILKEQKYPIKVMQKSDTNHFNLTRKAKQKSQEKMGKGKKPNACSPLSDEDINLLYEKEVLGNKTPHSLLNTICLNNCVHIGIKGTTECRTLRWNI